MLKVMFFLVALGILLVMISKPCTTLSSEVLYQWSAKVCCTVFLKFGFASVIENFH